MSKKFSFPEGSVIQPPAGFNKYDLFISGQEYGTGKYFSEQVSMTRPALYCWLRSKRILDVDIYMETEGKWNVPVSELLENSSGFCVKENITGTGVILSPVFSFSFIAKFLKDHFSGIFDTYNKNMVDFNLQYSPRDYTQLRNDWYYHYRMGTHMYTRYIKSVRWKTISERIKLLNNNTCQICRHVGGTAGSTGLTVEWDTPIDVHHLTYEHLYDEYDLDLLALCRECHKKIHDKDNGGQYDPKILKGSHKLLLQHRKDILEGKILQ